MEDLIGYAHPYYARSLQEFGEPRELPRCGGWILVRPILGTPYKDAMGCYPLSACRDWSSLREDLKHVGSDLVTLALVTDPFAKVTPTYLEQCFDFVMPFKTHYVTNLSCLLENIVKKDHRYYARKSQKAMDIEICLHPAHHLGDWMELYDNLIRKHRIEGIRKFSPKCFETQLTMPGMIMFLGRVQGEVVGATLVLVGDRVAYAHLSAYASTGYKIRASYGIRWTILAYLQEHGIQYFDGGGTAGIDEDSSDGLAEFKKGWSNEQRTVFFCGRVFDRQKYESICRQRRAVASDYFPAYRLGEFG